MSDYVKICIGFALDDQTNDLIGSIHGVLVAQFKGDITGIKESGDLPYHITILGGLQVYSEDLKCKVEYARSQLHPFTQNKLPVIVDVEPAHLPSSPSNPWHLVGIRFKLAPGSYVLTGDKLKNVALAKLLGNERFNFNLARHTTICNVEPKAVDDVLAELELLVDEHSPQLMAAVLTPTIYYKAHNGWMIYPQ